MREYINATVMLDAFSSYFTSNEEQDESIVKMNIEMRLSSEWGLLKSKWTIISVGGGGGGEGEGVWEWRQTLHVHWKMGKLQERTWRCESWGMLLKLTSKTSHLASENTLYPLNLLVQSAFQAKYKAFSYTPLNWTWPTWYDSHIVESGIRHL